MDPRYQSEINRDVPPARPGEFAPLQLGPLRVDPPVVLAPMAGVTNYPFRAVCRRFGAAHYVSEMISARGLVEGHQGTLRIADFGPDEDPRALQIYGVEPASLAEATRRLVGEGRVDHIDMNFGCPVRKVTSKGGGSAIPAHPRLLARLVRAVVQHAGEVPVTIKFRMGIDDEVLTYRESGRIGEAEGCVAVGLHARTAAELYDGHAHWEAIADLKQHVGIPVLGNGDIWEAEDALRMMRTTGCDGVIVGRGCLGRPWLFRDLVDVFAGRAPSDPPALGEVLDTMVEHARRLAAWFGEVKGMRMMRRFTSWYTKSFPGSAALRVTLVKIESVADLEAAIADVDRSEPFPVAAMRVRRGKSSGRQQVALPEGWLEDREDATSPGAEAEELVSGG
jgi:nifR3 family TIM-barrel protein